MLLFLDQESPKLKRAHSSRRKKVVIKKKVASHATDNPPESANDFVKDVSQNDVNKTHDLPQESYQPVPTIIDSHKPVESYEPGIC